jgi:CheY-like chemotaxis protein
MREKFHIVVADDDVDDQELMKRGLKDCRVKVELTSVYNGIQLMDLLLKQGDYKHLKGNPDLILLDLNMPLMDGFEALRDIRKHSKLKDIPVFVITTSRTKRDRELALELGASGFYSKGASSKDIVAIMKEICEECFA